MFSLSRPALALASAALLLALTACSSNASASEGAVPGCQTASDLGTVQPDAAPVGPATACLTETSIQSVDSTEQPSLPIHLTDAGGTNVTVTSLDRVLALDISGTLAATVYALGLGDHLVGRDQSTTFTQASKLPVVTQSGHTITAEPILALDPTLIITDGSLGPNSVMQQLRASGIPVVYVESERSLDTVDTITTQVAAALGVPTRGTALTEQLDAQLASAQTQVGRLATASTKPRVIFLYLRGSASIYYLFGTGSGADTLIDALGAEDVASEMGWSGMKPVTAEALVAAAPDAVLVMTDGLSSVGGIDGLLSAVPALAQTPAGQNRRIIDMADDEILSFGPRSAEVLAALAQALYAPSTLGSSSADARG